MNNRFLEANPGEREKTDWAQKLYGVIVFLFGVALVVQLFSAWIATFEDVTPTDTFQDMLENNAPLFYIPALILYFCKCREFPIFLTLAYAYDMGINTSFFQPWAVSRYVSEYPVFILVSAALLITGFFYKGFWERYRWIYRMIRDRRRNNEGSNSFLEPKT